MKAKERMHQAVIDHSLHRTHVDRFKSLNLEVHERGILQKQSMETLSDYKAHCSMNKKLKNMELHEFHINTKFDGQLTNERDMPAIGNLKQSMNELLEGKRTIIEEKLSNKGKIEFQNWNASGAKQDKHYT